VIAHLDLHSVELTRESIFRRASVEAAALALDALSFSRSTATAIAITFAETAWHGRDRKSLRLVSGLHRD